MTGLLLQRGPSSEAGTFGILFMEGIPLCVTCEDPWHNNITGASCIPVGKYECVKHNGTKYSNVWKLLGVPHRDFILIHNGNTINDTKGCILVGKSFGATDGLPSITDSRITLNMLRQRLPDNFTLTIQ
jgi:hypothetical protein